MPSTVIEFEAPSTLTINADLVDEGDNLVITSATALEATNSKGIYQFIHTGPETGIFLIVYYVGNDNIGRQWINIVADDTSVYRGVNAYLDALNLDMKITDVAASIPPGLTVNEIWDEPQAGHVVPDSFGEYLDLKITDAAASAGGATVEAIWNELQVGYVIPGSFGYYLDTQISGIGGSVGPGANPVVIAVSDGANPVAQSQVWISTDKDGQNIIAGTIYTNELGEVTFMLTYGLTYYIWANKSGFNPIRGQQIVAGALHNIALTPVSQITTYNDRRDIELVFGASNVEKWANIDNNMTATDITDRVTWAIESAFDEFNEALRRGKYDVPLVTIPQSITRNAAILSGIWLYDARGVIDMQDDQYQHRLMYLRKRVESFLQGIRSGKQVIDLDLNVERIVPEVIDAG